MRVRDAFVKESSGAIRMKLSMGLALAGAMHTNLWLGTYALYDDLDLTIPAPTSPSLAMPSLHNPVSPRPFFTWGALSQRWGRKADLKLRHEHC
jgi:hypothetical protein